MTSKKILRIENLKTYFDTFAGLVKAVDGVSIEVREGETLGLVGESGSGKSVTALSVLRIVPRPGKICGGKILYKGENLLDKTEKELENATTGLLELEEIPSKSEIIDHVYRAVHTIKGNACLLDLDFFAGIAHNTENALNQLKEDISEKEYLNISKRNMFSLKKTFEELKGIINQISGIHDHFRPRRTHEYKMLMHSLEKLAERLCEGIEKKVRLNFEGLEEGHIPFEYKLMIRDILVQLVRNSIVHGIESSEDRLKKGKPEFGNIWVSVSSKNNSFRMTFKDDGKGLDLKTLKAKLLSSKKWEKIDISKMNDHQIGEFIFEPGISTTESTDINAGRGVGMDIIKKKVDKAGGAITLETKTDLFTSFLIELPLKKN